MTPTESTSTARHTEGVILMILAMLSIPSVDGIAKHLTVDGGYSPLFLGWARYAIASVVVLPFAAAIHGRRVLPAERLRSHVLRTVFLTTAMTLYFFAIARIPLATAVSVYLVAPIIAVVLSVTMLGERMTSRKVISLAFGLVGSLIILRPQGSTDPGMLLALAAGVVFALYMITTRQAAMESDPIKTLVFQCAIGTALLTPQAVMTWSTPTRADLLFFAGLGVFSAISHLLSIVAFRLADASTLAPLVYIELVGSALIGYFAFNEVPGVPTIVGAGFIVAAGLLLLQRRRPRTADARESAA